MSYLLDTAGLGITVAYNLRMGYSWSSYGENVFLLAQNVRFSFHFRGLRFVELMIGPY